MNAPANIPPIQRRKLRASDFAVLCDAGALTDVAKAELLDGDIYCMSPQTTRHARLKTDLAFALQNALVALGSPARVVVEVSVIAADTSVPEPDIVVSTYTGDQFMPAATVALAIEVSTTTLALDLGRKAELYAAAGIPEYWVVDVAGEQTIVLTTPAADGYQHRAEVAFGEALIARTIPGLALDGAVLRP